MSKFNIAGVVCIALGLLIILFQMIASQMGDDYKEQWSEVTIEHWAAPEQLEWIDNIKWNSVQRASNYLIATPVPYMLFVLGGLCLLIGSLLWKR